MLNVGTSTRMLLFFSVFHLAYMLFPVFVFVRSGAPVLVHRNLSRIVAFLLFRLPQRDRAVCHVEHNLREGQTGTNLHSTVLLHHGH